MILSELQKNCDRLKIESALEYSKNNYIAWCNVHRLFLKMAFMTELSINKVKKDIFKYLKQNYSNGRENSSISDMKFFKFMKIFSIGGV